MNNKSRIRILIAAAFITIGSAVLASCNQITQNPSVTDGASSPLKNGADGNKAVLDYYTWDDEESYIMPVVDAYNALQSSVQINLHVLNSTYYEDNIQVLLSADTKIDLLGIKGISQMVQIRDKGQLLDLTSCIKNNDMDVTAYGSMFNDIAINGRYYGIPSRSTCWVLVYNKDLFDSAGISYPENLTWEEYRQLAILLTKGDGENKIYGGYWVPWCYNFAAIQRSSYLIDDDLSLAKESLALLNTFYNLDGSHMSYRQMTDQMVSVRKEFERGTIAMMPQGEWILNMLMEDERKGLTDINWDIAPMPVFSGQESGITWGQYQFVSITSDTPHPEEAFDFVRFLCGEEGARIYAGNGIIHAYSNDDIEQIYLNAVGKESASIFFEAKKVQEQLAISGYQDVLDAFGQCAEEYFLGRKTLDEAMSDFERMRKDILTSVLYRS